MSLQTSMVPMRIRAASSAHLYRADNLQCESCISGKKTIYRSLSTTSLYLMRFCFRFASWEKVASFLDSTAATVDYGSGNHLNFCLGLHIYDQMHTAFAILAAGWAFRFFFFSFT